ncbi:MAG: hypothetical protein ABI600_13890 [Luteolibacter sp.]
MSIPAHYDGSQVLLDENVTLRPNARLIVTVLDDSDDDRESFLRLAESGLAEAYADDEVEYTLADIKPERPEISPWPSSNRPTDA